MPPTKTKKFPCTHCQKKFSRNFNLKRHEKEKHSPSHKKFACSFCFATFTRLSKLTTHIDAAHGASLAKVLSPEMTSCPFCSQDFSLLSYNFFLNHVSVCRLNPSVRPRGRSRKTPAPIFNCPKCGKVFRVKANFMLHSSRVHDSGAGPDPRYEDSTLEPTSALMEIKDSLMDGSLDPHLLFKRTQDDKVWSEKFRTSSFRDQLIFTPLASQLAAIGLLLEVVLYSLRSLLNSQLSINERVLACQVALDSPFVLTEPISSPLQLIEHFNLSSLIYQLERVLQSKKTLGMDSPLVVDIKRIYAPSIGGARALSNSKRKDFATFLSRRNGIFDVSIYQRNNAILHECCLMLSLACSFYTFRLKMNNKSCGELHQDIRTMLTKLYRLCQFRIYSKLDYSQLPILDAVLRDNFDKQLIIFQLNSSRHNDYTLIFSQKPYLEPSGRIHLLQYKEHFYTVMNYKFIYGLINICDRCGFPKGRHHKCFNENKKCHACCSRTCLDSWSRDDPNTLCPQCNRCFKSPTCFKNHKDFGTCEELARCEKCFKVVKRVRLLAEHKCLVFFCGGCREHVPIANHQCFITNYFNGPLLSSESVLFFFADFETGKDSSEPNRHLVNLAIAHKTCPLCIDDPTAVAPKCCGTREKIFLGTKTISEYVDWQFFNPAHKNAFVFFHYGSGFDGHFILKELTTRGHAPKVICRGRKFILLEAGFNVRVKDSYCFLPFSLSSFPKLFGVNELKKGFFPFALSDTQQCFDAPTIPLPPSSAFLFSTFSKSRKAEFMAWYKQRLATNNTFNYKEEAISYCRSDVLILAQTMAKFRAKMVELVQIDPLLTSFTLAHFVGNCYRLKFLDEKHHIPKLTNTNCVVGYLKQKQSLAAMNWMEYLNSTGAKIQHAGNSPGEFALGGNRKADGFSPPNNVWEFNGCFVHGCIKCFNKCTNTPHPLFPWMRYSDVYHKTLMRERELTNAGHIVHTMWECQRTPQMLKYHQDNETSFVEPIKSVREAYFGGRVNAAHLLVELSTHHLQEGWEISYHDLNNLYGTEMKNHLYPCGQPLIIPGRTVPLPYQPEKYLGLVRAKVLPPTDLYFP